MVVAAFVLNSNCSYYIIYVVVRVSRVSQLRDTPESNLSSHHRPILCTMERRVWCAIAGRDKLLHVDATNCRIVYELRKAAVDLSRIKIPYIRVDIWKVS